MDRFAPCTGRMLHQSYSLAVRLDTAVYVKRFPLLFRRTEKIMVYYTYSIPSAAI